MNARALIAAVAALVMLLPVAAAANGQGGQPIYQVSGGGQFDVPVTGPGSTIAFTAQLLDEDSGAARGQLQVIERDGPGPGDRFHGVVDCVIPDFVFDDGSDEGVEGARFGGHERGDDSNRFIVDVVDNGQPNDGDNDLIFFNDNPDPDEPCENGDDLPEFELGRGNVKIHDRR